MVRSRARREGSLLPGFIEPCLATLVTQAPRGPAWLHEVKWDGYRLLISIGGGKAVVRTRRGHDWTSRFPTIAAAATALPASAAILDGEAVVHDRRGVPSFSALQAALGARQGPGHLAAPEAILYAFDLLHIDGEDLRDRPLVERRDRLAELMAGVDQEGHLRLSESIEGDGPAVLRQACTLGLEGIVSKRRDRPYRSGRGKDWLKTKCAERQEFVVAGYVVRSDAPKSVGALALGYYERGHLAYAGRVGTGFTAPVARSLWERLQRLRIDRSPFHEQMPTIDRKGLVWVTPELVAEVEFRGWSSDGRLRHPSFQGLREDKPAIEVVREDKP